MTKTKKIVKIFVQAAIWLSEKIFTHICVLYSLFDLK